MFYLGRTAFNASAIVGVAKKTTAGGSAFFDAARKTARMRSRPRVFLEQIADELKRRTYVPLPAGARKYRRTGIKSACFRFLQSGIAQGALKLILGPIFEADF